MLSIWTSVDSEKSVMQKAKKKLEVLEEDDDKTMSTATFYSPFSSTPSPRCSWRVLEEQEDLLNTSAQISHHNPAVNMERRLHEHNSSLQEITLPCYTTNSISSTEPPPTKPTSELVKEIVALELEVIELEQYLLSLYRNAFDQYLTRSPTVTNHGSNLECNAESPPENERTHTAHHAIFPVDSDEEFINRKQSHSHEQRKKKRAIKGRNGQSYTSCNPPADSENSISLSARENLEKDTPNSASGHCSLADHLSASLMDQVPEYSCKLSEDIISCIAAIYCKLATPGAQPAELIASSPTASLSSSSTFSPQDDPRNSWSPRCFSEVTGSPLRTRSLKYGHNPYGNMVEIPSIHVDGDKFEYASKMLNIFRSLIQRLEAVDPKKMEHHQQLTFWINIYNALVMHAFLAYGLHQNHMKSTISSQKATYNIGGHSINAYVIQSLIIGCQPHRPTKWLRALVSPAKQFIKKTEKHPYALHGPEPLAHFALSFGAYSDPAVRAYTAKSIFQELEIARDEYIQANVSLQKKTKILLPRVLHYYAKDASLKLSELLKMVCKCMPEAQQKVMQGCIKEKVDKCVEWSPYKQSFRYLVHRDLVKQ